MENKVSNNTIGIEVLLSEIMSGECIKDILPNSALGFSNEHQAQYFSNFRRNLQSDMAHSVISGFQNINDIEILKRIKG